MSNLYRYVGDIEPELWSQDYKDNWVPVERCRHGKIDPHDHVVDKWDDPYPAPNAVIRRCPGSPTLLVHRTTQKPSAKCLEHNAPVYDTLQRFCEYVWQHRPEVSGDALYGQCRIVP